MAGNGESTSESCSENASTTSDVTVPPYTLSRGNTQILACTSDSARTMTKSKQATAEPMKFTYQHEQLGTLTGWQLGNVVQFRGLPYATIPGRFRQSQLRHSLPTQPFDATNPGPTCPHPPQQYWPYWTADLLDDLPKLQPPRTDEFECLNLSLTIPIAFLPNLSNTANSTTANNRSSGIRKNLSSDRRLPVFVFIHGGAFVGGSHAIQLHGREVFDGAGLVKHSLDSSKPMIVIGINYRVGPFGFLTSRELKAFSSAHNEAAGNYGLHDQRVAFEWIHTFIAGFGGDSDRVTVQGTSAGATSAHLQCTFPGRRFQRAILASGTAFGIGAVEIDQQQEVFDRLFEATCKQTDETGSGLPGETKKVKAMQNVDVHVLTHGIEFGVCNPLIDGFWIKKGLEAEAICPEIMVGACLREDEICEGMLRRGDGFLTDEEAWKMMNTSYKNNEYIQDGFPFANEELMKLYGLEELAGQKVLPGQAQSPRMEIPKYVKEWAELQGHVIFNFGTYLLAEKVMKIGAKVWLYHDAQENHFLESHSVDMAHHAVNDHHLFNVAEDQVPEEHLKAWKGAVEALRGKWIEFVNGEAPWSVVSDSEKMGPVYKFVDGTESAEYGSLGDALGSRAAAQWEALKSGSAS